MGSAGNSKISLRNLFGFTTREMIPIARNLHVRAKERIVRRRTKEFRGSTSVR